ncbi:hypothetical protein ACU5AX_11525 [Sphingomonas sp. XXL09]|uniref:hypothetical protein n=1 Tax=Sphingomonas sp. XXL09 TaxID=3457787 RepID=UPI00406BD934
MVKMSNVWDRSTEVLSGRGGMLAGIAIPTLFVPAVLRALWALATAPVPGTAAGPAAALVGGLLAIVIALISLWGQLALIAAASDPATQAADARHLATARFLPALGIAALLVAVLTVLALPPAVLAIQAGFDFTAPAGAPQPVTMAPGTAIGLSLYLVVLGLVILFVGARLVPLYAVVVNERRGLGAIAEAWRLTRRHTWRIVGVLLLWGIVLLIATWAAQAVVGTVFRLALGAGALNVVAFLVAVVGAAVSTVFSVIAIVFTAQLYVALVRRARPAA